MTRAEFAELLQIATNRTRDFAQLYVLQELTPLTLYKVVPNQSCDENPLVDDEELYPGDSIPEGSYFGPLTADSVVDYLWRHGKVPEWIDIRVDSIVAGSTLLAMDCCGRYTAARSLLYYEDQGTGPFGVKSPYLPIGYDMLETSGKFDLHWRPSPYRDALGDPGKAPN